MVMICDSSIVIACFIVFVNTRDDASQSTIRSKTRDSKLCVSLQLPLVKISSSSSVGIARKIRNVYIHDSSD